MNCSFVVLYFKQCIIFCMIVRLFLQSLLVGETPRECPEFQYDKLMTLVKTGRGEHCFHRPSHKGPKCVFVYEYFFWKLSYLSKVLFQRIISGEDLLSS